MRICPFTGCREEVPPSRFACGRHWSTLDPEQRTRIWAVYRQWQRGEINGAELRRQQGEVVAQVEGG